MMNWFGDVVVTAAYAVLGRWNEDYDLWDESRAVAYANHFWSS
jgi:iron complex transport system ATP-binding protein